MSDKWRVVSVVALGEFLAISLWFSASAVTPALVEAWALKSGDAAWLTMSVQIGFVVGALLSATFNLADIWALHRLFAAGAWAGRGRLFCSLRSPTRPSGSAGAQQYVMRLSSIRPVRVVVTVTDALGQSATGEGTLA